MYHNLKIASSRENGDEFYKFKKFRDVFTVIPEKYKENV